MKVLKCTQCGDLVPLKQEEQSCGCGACSGRYLNLRKAAYWGPGEIYGVKGLEFYSGRDWRDKMFRLSDDSPNVIKKDA